VSEELELKKELARLLAEKEQRVKYRLIDTYFPEEGKYSKDHYPKHLEFMKAGAKFPERAFIAANRVGKTLTGGCEAVYHLTGLYPGWWEGRRFDRPVRMWICSITPTQMKDAVQSLLFGSFADKGTGLIPKEFITKEDGTITTWNMAGTSNVVGTALIKWHDPQGNFGGWSQIEFKTYEQGWEKFQGAKIDVIWLDEEPRDHKIYSECVTRTAGDTGDTGIIYCTFTPLLGYSDTVLSFLPDGQMPLGGIPPEAPWKKIVCAGWDDVPHLDPEWKKQRLASYSIHERDARTRGIPTKGSGAIYPYPESDIIEEARPIPGWWPRVYGLDVGWNCTAAVWIAFDPTTSIYHVYAEHYQGEKLPAVHASAIKARGQYIIGAIDPKSHNRSSADGNSIVDLYFNEGLRIVPADNSVEGGIAKVSQLFATGRLRIMACCPNTLAELRIYRRDENGKIVKKKDHAMDALRYAIMTGLDYLEVDPEFRDENQDAPSGNDGRSKVTGY
jgi:phage terminase large subunit-like protein